MTKRDVAWLLAELAQVEESRKGTDLTDDMLLAYRQGLLTETEAQRVELILCQDSDLRARLSQLAGATMVGPSPELKSRVLSALPRRRNLVWLPAAAMVAAVLIAGWLWFRAPDALPGQLAFTLKTFGEANVRDLSESAEHIIANPNQRLKMVISPKGTAVSGLEFGLYRVTDNFITKIPNDLLTLDVSRGVATFAGRASDLCGSNPGSCQLWVVVAREGDLPGKRRVAPGQDPGALLAVSARRLVYPQTVEIRPDTP